VKPESEKEKEVAAGRDKIAVKLKNQKLENELKIYKILEPEGIPPAVLAIILDEDNDDKVIGFITEAFSEKEPTLEDEEEVKKALERMHKLGVIQ
jgi:hypothetical protein